MVKIDHKLDQVTHAKKLLFNVEKIATNRIEKGLSLSEQLVRELTNTKLSFLTSQ